MRKIKKVMVALAIFTMVALAASVKLGYPMEGEYEVTRVEKLENIHGNSDGFDTELKYYVYTDQGVFLIELSGLNAYPYGLQLIGRDLPKTVRMKTRGARMELLGLYPNIIEIVDNYGEE